jgi:hypothetical protein
MYWIDWTYLTIKPGHCSTEYSKIAFYLELYCSFIFIIIPFIIISIINAITFCQIKKNKLSRKNFKKDKNLFKFSSAINSLFLIRNLPVYITLVINSSFNLDFSSFLYNLIILVSYCVYCLFLAIFGFLKFFS